MAFSGLLCSRRSWSVATGDGISPVPRKSQSRSQGAVPLQVATRQSRPWPQPADSADRCETAIAGMLTFLFS